MKYFKFTPLTIALASVLVAAPAAYAAVPSEGDLDIYTAASVADKGPTMLFMFDASRFMAGDLSSRDRPDSDSSAPAVATLKYEEATDSSGTITYRRRFFQAFPIIRPDNPKYWTRMTRLKDAIFYLLDTPGLLPEDYKIGAGHYPASRKTASSGPDIDYSENNTVASSQTFLNGAIMVPAKTLGSINSPHRMKLKRYVASLCDMAADNNTNTLQDCGEAPMAWSYADAGAYMMGTKTTELVSTGKGNTSLLFETVMRGRNPLSSGLEKEWQYCPEDKRKMVTYTLNVYRLNCREEDWVSLTESDNHGLKWYTSPLETISRPYFARNDLARDATVSDNTSGWVYYRKDRQSDIPRPPSGAENVGSGIRNSPWDVRSDKGYTYQQPKYSECSGVTQKDSGGNDNGQVGVTNSIIYFTAGWPYNSNAKSPKDGMELALTPALPLTGGVDTSTTGGPLSCDSGLPGDYVVQTGIPLASHWGCMGGFAKRLNSINNPTKKAIKTGVVVFTPNDEVGTDLTVKNGKTVLDCDSLPVRSQQNACKLGTPGYGYGEGGFAQITRADSEDSTKFANIILNMAEVKESGLGFTPSSSMTVPQDDYKTDALLDTSYLPLMSPTQSSIAQWQGNLRQYEYDKTKGTYVDKNDNSPYTVKYAALLAPTTLDLWSKKTTAYNASKQAGGVYENIKLPTAADTAQARTVYLSEDNIDIDSSSTALDKLVATKNAITAVDVAGITGDDKTTLQRLLLNYMGFGIGAKDYADVLAGATGAKTIESFYDKGIKSFGGVNHSTPIALTSKLTYDSASKEYKVDNRYILFGAMDNALHIVNEKTGKEVLSYFPREVLANNGQYKAITAELSANKAQGEISPSFGVDAPWTSYVKFSSGENNAPILAEELYAYGGARLGAKAYYGLDLTGIHETGFKPKQLFTITPDTKYKSLKVFDRLGYTWAKPVITKINWQGQRRLVAVLTGGYDTFFDKTDSVRRVEYAADKTAVDAGTKGNAIYIVDAKTGQPLIVASSSVTSSGLAPSQSASTDANVSNMVTKSGADDVIYVNNSNLKYSIPGSVKVLDRDADELTDNIYFTDLNGQVFRMDIDNLTSKVAKAGTPAVPVSNPAVRVVRLANLVEDSGLPIGPRFYETPVVTIHSNGDERFAVVSMASGDRSNPLWPFVQPSYEVVDGGDKISVKGDPGSKVRVVIKRGVDETELLSELVVIDDDGTGELDTSAISTDNPKMLTPSDTIKLSVEMASDKAKNNYVYAIYDKDVGKTNFFSTKLTTKGTGFADLANIPTDIATSNFDKAGWKAMLNQFDVYTVDADGKPVVVAGTNKLVTTTETTKGVKSLGSLSAIASKLYVPIYSPNDGLGDKTGCTAEVKGSAEAVQYCLPYGICDAAGTTDAQVQRFKTGRGVQNIVFGASGDGTKGNPNQNRSLIVADGTNKPGDTVKNDDLNSGAPATDTAYNFTPLLRPMAWFDLQSQKLGTNTASATTTP